MQDIKRITIHGHGTTYKLSIFKFGGDDDFWGRTGFGHFGYIGAIVWSPDSFLLMDQPHGYAPYAVRKAKEYLCPVLVAGWDCILRNFDDIKDGDNLEVVIPLSNYGDKNAWEYAGVSYGPGWRF